MDGEQIQAPLVTGFSHVGLAVNDVERMVDILRAFGYEVVARKQIVGQGTSRVMRSGTSAFDLLDPNVADGRLARFVQHRGPGLHHVCVEVSDLEAAVEVADRLQLRHADKPIEDEDGRLVFVHPISTQGLLLGLFQPRR